MRTAEAAIAAPVARSARRRPGRTRTDDFGPDLLGGPAQASSPDADQEPWQVGLYRRSIKKKETIRALLRLLPPLEGARCLEVECGSGLATWVLRQRGGAWTCVDSDAELAEAARDLLGTEVQTMEGGRLPFPRATFDLVVAVNVVRHLEDDAGFASETARVLKPGGRLLLTTSTEASNRLGYRLKRLYGFTADRLRRWGDVRDGYSRGELAALLQGAGLEVERVESYARIFTEAVENTLLYLYYRSARSSPDSAERHPAGTWSVSGRSLRSMGWKLRAFRVAYPVLRGLSLLDRLIPFREGYMLCARARKPG